MARIHFEKRESGMRTQRKARQRREAQPRTSHLPLRVMRGVTASGNPACYVRCPCCFPARRKEGQRNYQIVLLYTLMSGRRRRAEITLLLAVLAFEC